MSAVSLIQSCFRHAANQQKYRNKYGLVMLLAVTDNDSTLQLKRLSQHTI